MLLALPPPPGIPSEFSLDLLPISVPSAHPRRQWRGPPHTQPSPDSQQEVCGSALSLPGSGDAARSSHQACPPISQGAGSRPTVRSCPDLSGSVSLQPPVFLSALPLTVPPAASLAYPAPGPGSTQCVLVLSVHTSQGRDLQMVNMFFPLVSCSFGTLVGTWGQI